MTKTGLAKSTSRHGTESGREITKPTIFDLYEQLRDIVSPRSRSINLPQSSPSPLPNQREHRSVPLHLIVG